MDNLIIQEYAVSFGVKAIVLSLVICLVRFILKKTLKDKINEVTRSYLEIAFAILSEFIYSLILLKDTNIFSIKSVSSALLSYSLSLIIYSLIRRIVKGKPLKVETTTLLIEELLYDYVDEKNLSSVSKSIASAIKEGWDKDRLLNLLKEKLSCPEDDEEIIALLDLILSTIKKI